MKKKINLLIGISTLVLLLLVAIQVYLVKTTYDYKVQEFRSEVKEKIGAISNNYTELDSGVFLKKDLLYKRLLDKFIENKEFRHHIKSELLTNHYKHVLTQKLQEKLNQAFPETEINFAVVVNKFIVFDAETATDTIFSESPMIQNTLYGDLTSLENAFPVRNYVSTTSGNKNQNYKLLTEDSLFVSVSNAEQIILGRMSAILILSILSLLVLISLFIIAIKSLIQQKKVADVKTDFINNMTHELKTPLTTLSVSTKMLARTEIQENHTFFEAVLETVERQNERLQHIIDQVMNNSLGFEEIALQKEIVKINSLLESIVADFQLAFPNIRIVCHWNKKETTLLLDKFHLTTAVNNVMENAVKYGCKTITISTNHQSGQFQLSIQDDGMGISKNKQHLLFEKFYRIEQGNLHNTKGLGLGLYYVDQIVKAHHGSVKVISDLGKGALFTISLPNT